MTQPPTLFEEIIEISDSVPKDSWFRVPADLSVTTASAAPPEPINIDAIIEAAAAIKRMANDQPKEILVLPDGMARMPKDALIEAFGDRRLFISETQFQQIKDEVKRAEWLTHDRQATLMEGLVGMCYGLPIRRLRDALG